jgi:hypothetical protein
MYQSIGYQTELDILKEIYEKNYLCLLKDEFMTRLFKISEFENDDSLTLNVLSFIIKFIIQFTHENRIMNKLRSWFKKVDLLKRLLEVVNKPKTSLEFKAMVAVFIVRCDVGTPIGPEHTFVIDSLKSVISNYALKYSSISLIRYGNQSPPPSPPALKPNTSIPKNIDKISFSPLISNDSDSISFGPKSFNLPPPAVDHSNSSIDNFSSSPSMESESSYSIDTSLATLMSVNMKADLYKSSLITHNNRGNSFLNPPETISGDGEEENLVYFTIVGLCTASYSENNKDFFVNCMEYYSILRGLFSHPYVRISRNAWCFFSNLLFFSNEEVVSTVFKKSLILQQIIPIICISSEPLLLRHACCVLRNLTKQCEDVKNTIISMGILEKLLIVIKEYIPYVFVLFSPNSNNIRPPYSDTFEGSSSVGYFSKNVFLNDDHDDLLCPGPKHSQPSSLHISEPTILSTQTLVDIRNYSTGVKGFMNLFIRLIFLFRNSHSTFLMNIGCFDVLLDIIKEYVKSNTKNKRWYLRKNKEDCETEFEILDFILDILIVCCRVALSEEDANSDEFAAFLEKGNAMLSLISLFNLFPHREIEPTKKDGAQVKFLEGFFFFFFFVILLFIFLFRFFLFIFVYVYILINIIICVFVYTYIYPGLLSNIAVAISLLCFDKTAPPYTDCVFSYMNRMMKHGGPAYTNFEKEYYANCFSRAFRNVENAYQLQQEYDWKYGILNGFKMV